MRRKTKRKTAAKKVAKKRPVPRPGLHRPRNGGAWTEARFRGFIMTNLRNARWGPKYDCIKAAFRSEGPNPETGRKCRLHECSRCHTLVAQKDIQADHIVPVIGPEGFQDWDTVIRRMFVEKDGYRALCRKCHQKQTNMDRFNLDEAGVEILGRVLEFTKQPLPRQIEILTGLGAEPGHCVNAKVRREAYHTYLTHGNLPSLNGPPDQGDAANKKQPVDAGGGQAEGLDAELPDPDGASERPGAPA